MESKTWELINFLKELYQEPIIIDGDKERSSEIHILDLNLTDLWDVLSDKWGFLDKSALDINYVAEDYNKRKNKWKWSGKCQ